MKWHFLSSVLFVTTLVILTKSEDFTLRLLLMVGVILLFYLTLIVFAIEYDKQNLQAWKIKEDRLKKKYKK